MVRLAPKRMEKSVLDPKGKTKGKGESRIFRTLLGQATPRVTFDAKPSGLIQTLIFSEVNEINRLRTVVG